VEHAQEITPLFTAEEIASRVRALAGEIRTDAGPGEIFYLGILKGSALFLADLLRATPGDVGYGFIDVIRDMADNTTADALEIDFLSFTDIRGRNVYVLKDVVTSGIIETYLLGQLRMHHPRSLRLVALLDKREARTTDLETDFRAFEITDGATYAGYGLEKSARFGNLPYIGRTTG
jgi:hypoxanthine phosphoribosyltransferase